MTIREGLGYTLKNYDPCFDYNADLFCCSNRGRAFRANVAAREGKPHVESNANLPRNYNPLDDSVSLNMRTSGMVLPTPYNLTSMGMSSVPCGRMPCTINFNQVPCTNKPRACHWNHPCNN